MRRVTSRPRLFSWDQFDATARTDPHQEDPSSLFSFHIPAPPVPVPPVPLSEHQDGGDDILHHHYRHDNNNHNDDDDDDDDLDSDYMSCLSQSLHSNRRYSNHGNCSSYCGGGGVGPNSRSSSMLSLKNLSAHMSLEDEDDCSSSSNSARGRMTPCDTRENSSTGTATAAAMRMVGSKDHADASFTWYLDTTADDTCSSTSRLPVVHHRGEATVTNVVSPPGTPPPPRCGDHGCHHSMTTLFLEEDVSNGHCSFSNKKRNLDDLEKSASGAKTAAGAAVDGSIPSTTTTSAAGTATAAALPFNLLAALQQDVFIDCLQYLSLDDLKSLSITCSGFYHLLTFGSVLMDTKRKHRPATTSNSSIISSKREEGSHESSVSGIRNVLWWNWIRRQWPELALAPTQDTSVGSSLLSSLFSSKHDGEGGSRLLLSLLTPCNVQFVDRKSEHQGGVVVVGGGGGGSVGSHRMNYIALMSCSQSSPTCIAEKYFEERSGPVVPSNLMAPVVVPVEQSRPPLFRCFNNENMCSNNGQETVVHDGLQIVQYIGDVGIGDRSICTNRPFPKPILKNGKKWDDASGLEPHRRPYSMKTATASSTGFGGSFPFPSPSSSPIARLHGLPQHIHNLIQEQRELASNTHRHRLNIFERLRGCNMYNHSVGAVIEGRQQQQQHHWSRRSSGEDKEMEKGPQSFVSPYVSSMKLCVEIDLTPRMMAYFEVSILRKDDLNLKDDMDEDGAGGGMYRVQPRPRIVSEDGWNVPQNQNEVHSACVAVGLSTQGFHDSSRMPGWDSYSYGYHGDDGGIFHSHGEMIRVYGPTYNVGDIVGCGVNYLNGGIFYTLNGNFLGYAWVNEKIVMEGKADLYPTVGLDSADPIACNFGNKRPFVFNFAGFVANDGNMPISGPIAGNP